MPGEPLTGTGEASALAALLEEEGAYPPKVRALQEAIERRDPEALALARERLGGEGNSFVRASLIAVLGHLGDASDHARLTGELESPETRVVANALEALQRLQLNLTLPELARFLDHPDARVSSNALALLAAQDPLRVLERIAGQLESAPGARAIAMIRVLGQMAEHSYARQLLFWVLGHAPETATLRQAADALRKAARTRFIAQTLGTVRNLATGAQGDRRAVLDLLQHDLATDFGWGEAQIVEAARAQREACPAGPLPVTGTTGPGLTASGGTSGGQPPPSPPSRLTRKTPVLPDPVRLRPGARSVTNPASRGPDPSMDRAPSKRLALALLGTAAFALAAYGIRSSTVVPVAPVQGHASASPAASAAPGAVPAGAMASGSVFSRPATPGTELPPLAPGTLFDLEGPIVTQDATRVLVRHGGRIFSMDPVAVPRHSSGGSVRVRGRVMRQRGRLVEIEVVSR